MKLIFAFITGFCIGHSVHYYRYRAFVIEQSKRSDNGSLAEMIGNCRRFSHGNPQAIENCNLFFNAFGKGIMWE